MSRRLVWALAGAGVAAVLVGGAVSEGTTPASSSHAVSAETSSAAPATVAAVPSAESAATTSASDVAATSSAAAPTSAAALPVSPILSLSCPGSAAGAAPTFGHQIAATAPYTVVIDYGDGERYTNDDQHLGAIFSHRYQRSGTFTVGAVLTDAAGQTSAATCAYHWAVPAPVHASVPAPVHTSVPAPHSSTSGSGSGDTYVNVDGNTIHSPVTAPSAPAGATAKCNDGTWSFSQHHSGTCSHHGGVAEWL